MKSIQRHAGPRKHFDEPLVRAKISQVRFPKTCPVCNRSAPNTAMITASLRSKQWLRPEWDPAFYSNARKSFSASSRASKSFLIHVCEEHHATDDSNLRMRGLAMLLAAILSGMSIFALIFTGYDISSGRGIHPIAMVYLLILSLSLIFGYLAFRPTSLEAAVKIIGFDFDLQYVWLKLKNPEYRSRLIEENQMSSEVVNWVIMA